MGELKHELTRAREVSFLSILTLTLTSILTYP